MRHDGAMTDHHTFRFAAQLSKAPEGTASGVSGAKTTAGIRRWYGPLRAGVRSEVCVVEPTVDAPQA